MDNILKIEDRSLCAECGGQCCKKCGCDLFISDIEKPEYDYINKLLDSGRVSIVSRIYVLPLKNGSYAINPFLHLRARNIDREAIDLFSLKKTCASLEEGGCFWDLDHRPSGATHVKPFKNAAGEFTCKSTLDHKAEIKKWEKYQKLLAKIVKARTGNTVYEQLRLDVINVFNDVLYENFDGISKEALEEFEEVYPVLKSRYADEYKIAQETYKKQNPLLLRIPRQ